MPKKDKAAKAARKSSSSKSKPAKASRKALAQVSTQTAQLVSSTVVFECPLFRIQHDKLIDPGGKPSERDVIRHTGSVVILALDSSKSKKNPWVVLERQYRHAANQYLWELPAGKLNPGEDPLAGAQRELEEETGYRARKWRPLINFYASPGFLAEAMLVYIAEGLSAGDTHWDEDEEIEFRLVRLNDLLKMIDKGAIHDGKTLASVLYYARSLARKRKS
ncbi:MAG TPA: NUDIX hydrolase [Terracidiphilus sp.]|nr:NUDIX hydrolase [Terracidiphilus sp.]